MFQIGTTGRVFLIATAILFASHSHLSTTRAADASVAAPAVANGSMTDGKDDPSHWNQTWTASGKIAVKRDTTTFHSAPASLAVESVGGEAKGQTMQAIEAAGGTKFHVRGWIKAAGKGGATFGVQSYTSDWKGIEFQAIGHAPAGLDWTQAEGDVLLPANTARFGLVLMIDGNCTGWLDDVEISAMDPKATIAPKVEAPAKAPNSVTAAEGFYPQYPKAWRNVLNGQLERAKKGDIDVVFLGDSLTQGWAEQPGWKKDYVPLKAVDFGVGGDGTPQVLYRIDAGILDGYKAKVVVLMIGINNAWPGFKADDVGEGVKKVVAAVRQKQPDAKILLFGVLPIFDKGDGIRKWIADINTKAATLDDGKSVRFIDMGNQFVDAQGERLKELYVGDRLHLSAKGYEVWGKTLKPALEEALK